MKVKKLKVKEYLELSKFFNRIFKIEYGKNIDVLDIFKKNNEYYIRTYNYKVKVNGNEKIKILCE